jgi:hypothetical protein
VDNASLSNAGVITGPDHLLAIVAHEYCRQATIEQGIPARPYDDRPQWQEGMHERRLAPATTTFTGDVAYRYGAMDVDIIVPGHGPIGTKRDLAETRAYLELMVREVRRRYDAKMRPGQAAADIDMGRFAAWTNPDTHCESSP